MRGTRDAAEEKRSLKCTRTNTTRGPQQLVPVRADLWPSLCGSRVATVVALLGILSCGHGHRFAFGVVGRGGIKSSSRISEISDVCYPADS